MRTSLTALVLTLAVVLSGCGASFYTFEIQDIELEEVEQFQQTFVYAADGTQIATFRFENREPVTYADLPTELINALVAAEDRRFWTHNGVDPRAIGRAWMANRRAGTIVQGGSTITQQLVKNLYFPEAEATIDRKAHEARYAIELEREKDKTEIITEYFNTIYFGSGAYGIEAAAQTYFGVSTSQLDLAQATLIVGLIRSPESSSPHEHPERAVTERRRVLFDMAEVGYISEYERDRLNTAPLGIVPLPPPPINRYPYFIEFLKRTLVRDDRFGPSETARWRRLFGGGLRVYTTLDPVMQQKAEEAATHFWSGPDDPEVAIAVVRPTTGEVPALVGGRDFSIRQFDLATQSHRQPGSTFKVFAYTAALSRGWYPQSPIESGSGAIRLSENTRDVWYVRSSGGGLMHLHDALVISSNGAFARLAVDIGGSAIAQTASSMGIHSRIGSNPAIVLGGLDEGVSPLEMAEAFGTIANGGYHAETTPIIRIEDSSGQVIYEPEKNARHVIDQQIAWLVTDAMVDVVEHGTGRQARLGERPAAGKTGTVQDNVDAWFVGFTPELSTAVWIGYPEDRRPLVNIHGVHRVQGGNWPARIWKRFMLNALEGQPITPFPEPGEVTATIYIDPASGGLTNDDCPDGIQITVPVEEIPNYYCPSPEELIELQPMPTEPPFPTPTPTPTVTPLPTATPTELPQVVVTLPPTPVPPPPTGPTAPPGPPAPTPSAPPPAPTPSTP